MLSARRKLSATCAKSRQTPRFAAQTSAAVVNGVLLPISKASRSCTWSRTACTRPYPGGVEPKVDQASSPSTSGSTYRLGIV